ncbi:chemotaxis protein CheX [Spirochaetia bacterium]|nr:chemotaxis protein CheX [Spirochaetia bacterium]
MKQYIQPFIKVCTNVFRDLIGQELKAELPYFINKDEEHEWDVSAIIGLTGEARGAVVISMKGALAVKLTGILTGKEHNTMDNEVVDAIGEIVNIIAGNVKQELEGAFKLVISLPTIVKGKEHTIAWPNSHARIICIPFTIFNVETFGLAVALEAAK